jgi:predicted DNA-binding transcriptional regulator AlpA
MSEAANPTPHRLSQPPRRRLPPALVRRPQAAALCGLGASTFDRHDAAGLVPAARFIGGCKVWSVSELKAWAAHGCPPRAEWAAIWQAILTARRAGRAK